MGPDCCPLGVGRRSGQAMSQESRRYADVRVPSGSPQLARISVYSLSSSTSLVIRSRKSLQLSLHTHVKMTCGCKDICRDFAASTNDAGELGPPENDDESASDSGDSGNEVARPTGASSANSEFIAGSNLPCHRYRTFAPGRRTCGSHTSCNGPEVAGRRQLFLEVASKPLPQHQLRGKVRVV
jgi:hypothetical protein